MADALGLSHHAWIHWGLGLVTHPSVAGGGGLDKTALLLHHSITGDKKRSTWWPDRAGGQAVAKVERSNEAVKKTVYFTERGNDLKEASPSLL